MTSVAPVSTLHGFGGGVAAVSRSRLADGTPVVVKRLPPPGADDEQRFGPAPGWSAHGLGYWRRELDFYSSAWSTSPSLRAPRLLGTEQGPDGTVELHLESLDDVSGPTWGIDETASAARHLARFNAEHLGRVDTAPAWMSRSFLRTWFTMTTRPVVATIASGGGRGVGSVGTRSAADVLGAMWARRRELVARLQDVPTTVCHLDSHRGNLRVLGDGTVAAIDWAYVGVEALGADCAQLFASSAVRLLVPADRLAEHWEAVCDAYTDGLAESGCDPGARGAVRRWIALAVCLRWGAGHLFWLPHLDARRAALEETWWGRSFDEVEDELAAVSSFLLGLTARCVDA